MRLNLLKFIYKGILTGMPLLTYNPYNLNTFNVPMNVNPLSTYLNFKLNDTQTKYISDYISKFKVKICT